MKLYSFRSPFYYSSSEASKTVHYNILLLYSFRLATPKRNFDKLFKIYKEIDSGLFKTVSLYCIHIVLVSTGFANHNQRATTK